MVFLNSDGSFDINDIPIDAIKYIEIYKRILLNMAVMVWEEQCCYKRGQWQAVGFTQEFASFGTSKTLVEQQKMFEKPRG